MDQYMLNSSIDYDCTPRFIELSTKSRDDHITPLSFWCMY